MPIYTEGDGYVCPFICLKTHYWVCVFFFIMIVLFLLAYSSYYCFKLFDSITYTNSYKFCSLRFSVSFTYQTWSTEKEKKWSTPILTLAMFTLCLNDQPDIDSWSVYCYNFVWCVLVLQSRTDIVQTDLYSNFSTYWNILSPWFS